MVAVSKLGEIEYREIPVDVKPEVRVEGGQHLNVNRAASRNSLLDAAVSIRKNIRRLTYLVFPALAAVRFNSLTPEQQRATLSPVPLPKPRLTPDAGKRRISGVFSSSLDR